jgi:hypothetical protein
MKAVSVSGRSLLARGAGFLLGLSSCNPSSLDYLENGRRIDGATQDEASGQRDGVPPHAYDSASSDARGEANATRETLAESGRLDAPLEVPAASDGASTLARLPHGTRRARLALLAALQ